MYYVIEFVISPEDSITPEGLPSEFSCQHSTAGTVWRTNGMSVRGNATHIPGTFLSGDHVVYNLTILARAEFNGTIVECVAVDRNQSRYAQLLVQG